jgi:hypothetical protein
MLAVAQPFNLSTKSIERETPRGFKLGNLFRAKRFDNLANLISVLGLRY